MGLNSLQLIEPTLAPFPGTATTAVITSFQVGRQPSTISVRRVATLDELNLATPGEPVQRTSLSAHARWTILSRPTVERRADFVELGEYCRVHRGQATGANKIWIVNGESGLPPGVLFSTVTRARELLEAGLELSDCARLKHVIDIPPNFEEFTPEERSVIEHFLLQARALGADQGYIAQHRRPWWAVNLRDPAPILATYMARRSPVFVRNLARARHINVAHGLYPLEPMSDGVLMALARFLSESATVDQGRTYAGGLTKFEPGEMERILVPRLELLAHYVRHGELVR
ncbi:MAG: hypothetical protein IPK16_11750 [Anaerolineales bacterium]|nr:hypothetical protein [Anaerolineales bacterium]